MISLESLELFRDMLIGASLSVGADDFEENSRKAAKAKRELDKEIKKVERITPKKPKPSATKKRNKK